MSLRDEHLQVFDGYQVSDLHVAATLGLADRLKESARPVGALASSTCGRFRIKGARGQMGEARGKGNSASCSKHTRLTPVSPSTGRARCYLLSHHRSPLHRKPCEHHRNCIRR
jgi:hypothetical protein